MRFLQVGAISLVVLSASSAAIAAVIAGSAEAAIPLRAGARAPEVSVTTAAGAEFPLASAFAVKPTVVVFYRGSWCPYCNLQLAALGEAEPKLLAMGYQILAISPDSAAGLQAMAEKHQLKYQLLSDRLMTAAAAFGVAFRVDAATATNYRAHGVELAEAPDHGGPWLPVPSVFIVDRAGMIRFAHSDSNYKIRLSTPALLKAAKEALEKN